MPQKRKRPADGRIGKRLVEARHACGYSQGWLARRIGVSTATIQAYERGRARIAAERLKALADALQCDASDFLKIILPLAWLTF